MTGAQAPPAGLELFADCDDGEKARLASLLQPVEASAGEVLLRQGDVGQWFLLVVDGAAAVTRDKGDGRGPQQVGSVLPGSIVGELSLLRSSPRSATVTASGPFRAYRGDRDAFIALLEAPGVTERIGHAARQRLAANVRPVAVTARDGARFHLRPILATDRARVTDALARFSRKSLYRRFFTYGRLSDRVIGYLTDVDYVDHFAWVVLADSEPGDPVVAVGRYIREHDEAGTAEVAFSVIDDYQGRGLGRLLLAALAVAARENAVGRFSAHVLAENTPMRAVLARAGARWHFDEPGVLGTVVDVPSPYDGLPPASVAALREAVRDVVAAADTALMRSHHG